MMMMMGRDPLVEDDSGEDEDVDGEKERARVPQLSKRVQAEELEVVGKV